MNNFFDYFLIIVFINSVTTYIPIWDFKKTAIDLINNNDYLELTTEENTFYGDFWYKIIKKFNRNKYSISKKNILQLYFFENYRINTVINKEVDFEEVSLAFASNSLYYVCPKGKYHLHIYQDNSNPPTRISPKNFNIAGDWELKCYLQPERNNLFVSYLNKNTFYQLDINTGKIIKEINFKERLFDYKWTTDSLDNKNNMFAFYLIRKNISLGNFSLNIRQDGFEIEEYNSKQLFENVSNNFNLIFNNENTNFYFINYNNISDFKSGYSEQFNILDTNNLENVSAIINKDSPLEFIDEIIIEEIKFIKNTKYLYYKLFAPENNITYYGIIDIFLNKVIFNTNEEFKLFIPLNDKAMMAMTYNKLYKICSIYHNNDCIDKCPNGTNLVLDINGKNTCQKSQECLSFILKPYDICIDNCDQNIYTFNEKNECGLCKDLNFEKPYKLINTSTCLDSIPNGAVFINEKFKLLKCDNGYKLENEKCISMNCYSTCKTCSGSSNNETEQKCLSCKDGFFFADGNCVKVCPLGFFLSNNKCEKCNDLCGNCINRADNCISCKLGFYINNQNCFQCHKKCRSCVEGANNNIQNCESCFDNYLLVDIEGSGNNCELECPKNTIFDKSLGKCVSKKDDNSIIDIVIIILIVLLAIIICLMIGYCIRRYIKRIKVRNQMLDEIKKGDILMID